MSVFAGNKLTIDIFGHSHDPFIGGCVAGLPGGFAVDMDELLHFMSRRSPGRFAGSTRRLEADFPEIISGLDGGVTDGRPLTVHIRNTDINSADYRELRHTPRPGHADLSAWFKFGFNEDMSGGGQFSGRMTAVMCALGGIAVQILKKRGIWVTAHIRKIGGIEDTRFDNCDVCPDIAHQIAGNPLPVISFEAGERMERLITETQERKDSLGGIIECAVIGYPAGVGGALFDGMEAAISRLLFAIPAVKAVEFGAGMEAAGMLGSENNDAIYFDGKTVRTRTNNAGGILGGISDGMPIIFSAVFKPAPSIGIGQKTVDLSDMTEKSITVKGRHDACFVPRAVPVVEAMAALALLDLLED